ncbi:ABC transporter ATP-binding protein [Ruminococcus sp. OA3]|uniref:ABC transporter ATP-binding protein n=1 Tax=Ruminococcus sp. OA3 TaxID=2914164 RepID=UPI001F058C5C|nr:ABC transporter ATP-binding protein [Ruminococcus sp. OA3]MCH1984070.1 ABC transporter ATP-binding protein [Ruminococcus sp. OA3]
MNTEYIRLDHITKKFDRDPVLKDLNAVLKKGEILGFLGPSGAGKTTTIKILTGQLKPTSGDAYVLGIHVKHIDETIYEQIGIVTDQSGIYERMTVYENLKYFAKILKVDLKRVDELLNQVGLAEHRKKPAGKLSKGQTQRLVLARAVLHKPRVLFLDEPTSGLDPSTALDIHSLLKQLRDEGMSIFLTTHNMEEATKLCDHVALLNDGQIVEYGTPKELCLRYNSEKKYRVLLETGEELQLDQNEENINRIAEWMKGNQVEAIHSCEPTLETVFLTVTGRALQ